MKKILIYSFALILMLLQSTHAIYDLGSYLSPNTAALQIPGLATADMLGWQIANAGDFNKDGYDDIIVGAPGTGSNKGAVYVIYGKAGSSFSDINVNSLDPASTGFKITGSGTGSGFGNSVGGTGDINKDGYADIIITAANLNNNKGAVYVFYGKANPADIILSSSTTLNPQTTGFLITGRESGDQLGYIAGPAGDVNKDGYDDIIIGAPPALSERGNVYVVYGRPTTSLININLATTALDPTSTGFTITGATGDFLGNSVYKAGDINNDGYGDIIIGATKSSWQGAAYVIYGQAHPVDIDLTTTLNPATTGFKVIGKTSSDAFGFGVSTAGDINNDGFDDMVIGASARNSNKGAVQVIYGGPNSGFSNIDLSLTPLDPTTKGFEITASAASGRFGYFVAPAGDVNKDGFDDIVITARNQNSKGAVHIIYGGATSTRTDINLATDLDPLVNGFSVTGALASGMFGYSASSIDFNKDGEVELLVGAPYVNGQAGVGYVLFPSKMCSTFCASCSKVGTCDTCLPGYGTENSVCVACSPGKYSDGTGPCKTCPTGCSQCTSATSCQSCSVGYSQPSVNTLCTPIICSTGCTLCLSTTACNSCSTGYYLSNYACQPCPGGCSACSSSSVCSACLTGYSLPSGGGSGGKCCPDKCSTCTNYQLCTACKTGYGLLSSGLCGDCPPKTFLSGWNCASCPSHCKVCTSASSCTVCDDGGYGLLNSQCYKPCPAGTYLATNGKCESCLSSCGTCTDGSTCLTCKTGEFLHLSQCLDSCPDKTFISSNGLYCDKCPGECSKCTDTSVCTACETGYLFTLSKCISCPVGSYIDQINEKCQACSVGCSKCISDSICQECYSGYTLSASHSCDVVHQDQEEPPAKTREKAAGDTFDGASIAGAALASGSSLPINFGLVAKILRNLKYLNVTVSIELQETFYSWKVNGGFLKAPKSWSSESHSRPLPMVFRRYGLDPVFLINYWKPLILTMIGFVLFIAFKIMEIGLDKGENQENNLNKKKKDSIPRQLNVAASNFALTQIYSNLDDVIFYLVIDARSTEFDGAFRGFSFALALVLILIGGLTLGFHGFLLQKYQSLKGDKAQTGNSLEKFLKKYENIKLIFEDFKDTTLVVQSFLWIHLIRAIASSLLFVTLFEYPLAQTLILLVSNLGMIIFISVKSPFKDILGTCSQVFCEVVLLLANICMLIMAIFDQAKSYPIDAIKHLSRGVIILNAILLFGSAILMVVGVIKNLWTLYQARKKPQQRTPPEIKNNRINANADKFNSLAQINQSNHWQQQTSHPQEGFEYPIRDHFAPRQIYSNLPEGYSPNMNPINSQNQYEISDISYDINGGNPSNMSPSYQGSLDNNQVGTNTSFIDETMMNTSNANLICYNSLRPRILGKIKMPGGVEIHPRSLNNATSPVLEFQSPPLLYQNPVGSRSPGGFGSQLRSPDQMRSPEMNNSRKKNVNNLEEFILERTRARMKYHHARKNNS